jgi:hypothetical protein
MQRVPENTGILVTGVDHGEPCAPACISKGISEGVDRYSQLLFKAPPCGPRFFSELHRPEKVQGAVGPTVCADLDASIGQFAEISGPE